MDNKTVFASNLKYYMQISGKSRREVCEALGFSYYTFTDWVNGKKFPRMDKVEILANYFGILKSDLIEDKTLQDQIEENPVKMAELHFELIENEDFMGLFADYKKLDDTQKKIVADLVHNLAETKKEA